MLWNVLVVKKIQKSFLCSGINLSKENLANTLIEQNTENCK